MKINANLWTSTKIVLKSIKIYVKFTMVAPLHLDRFVYVLKQRRPQNNFTLVAPYIYITNEFPKKNHAGGPLNGKSYK